MANPWVAVDPGVDVVAWARLLRKAHDLALSKGTSSSILRNVVANSWMRCTSAGVDPERPAPQMLEEAEVAERLKAHPLARELPLIRALLADAADTGRYIMVLSDADGLLLWAEGHPDVLRTAEKPHFLPGCLCSESAVGTNAVGTALALDHPVQIFSAEHFNRLLHAWTCAAAPIHDPEGGSVLGALDVSGSFRSAHPHSLSLVSAVARAVEDHLAQELARREEGLKALYVERLGQASGQRSALVTAAGQVVVSTPRGWLAERVEVPSGGGLVTLSSGVDVFADPIENGKGHVLWQVKGRRASAPRPQLRLEALGKARASVLVMGEVTELRLRHSEILVLLALHPRGMSSEELAIHLYGANEKRVTVRAEMSRLRKLLGSLLAANPYRLVADVRADFRDVERRLEDGQVDLAVGQYAGRLLPSSEVPVIVAARQRLDRAVRTSVQAAGDMELLWRFLQTDPGRHDREGYEHLLRLMDETDLRREIVVCRLSELLRKTCEDRALSRRQQRLGSDVDRRSSCSEPVVELMPRGDL